MNEIRHITTNKRNCLTKLCLDTKVEGWAVYACLQPLVAKFMKKTLVFKIAFLINVIIIFTNISFAQNKHSGQTVYQSTDTFLIDQFQSYTVIFLGEHHRIKEHAEFVSNIIPILHSNGINLLFSEFANYNDTRLIDSLITAQEFNFALAKKIQFQNAWDWGYKELVDIYYAAWKTNQNLESNEDRFRIIGLENYQDSLILDQEKFWAYLIDSISIKQNQKSIVYCGMHHAFTNYKQPYVVDDTLKGFVNSRVGNYLYRKYPLKVETILLHAPLNGINWGTLVIPFDGKMDSLYNIYSVNSNPIGFLTENLKYGDFKLDNTFYSIGYPNVSINDLCQGYIIVKPICKLNQVTVIADFINKSNIIETRKIAEMGDLSIEDFNYYIKVWLQEESDSLLELKKKFCN